MAVFTVFCGRSPTPRGWLKFLLIMGGQRNCTQLRGSLLFKKLGSADCSLGMH